MFWLRQIQAIYLFFDYNNKLNMENIADQKMIRNQELFAVESRDIKQLLHRSIGALTFLSKYKKMAVGNGVLISPDLVLTAAHNIYDKKQKCQNDDFKFFLGADGVAEEYHQIESWRYLHEFKDCPISSRIPSDYALLKLKTPATFTEYLPLSKVCQHCIMDNNKQICLDIYGYPDVVGGNYTALDKYGNKLKLCQYGLSRKNRIVIIQPDRFMIGYAVSTFPGQSGTAVCIDNKIIAVHTGGGKMNDQFNVGRLLTRDSLQNLEEWRIQMCGKPFSLIENFLCPYSTISNNSTISQLKATIEKQNQKIIQLQNINKVQKRRINELQKELSEKGKQIASQTTKKITNQQISVQKEKIDRLEKKQNISGKQYVVQLIQKESNQQLQVKKESSKPNIELIPQQIVEKLQKTRDNQILDLSQKKLFVVDLAKHFKLTHLRLNFNQLAEIDLRNNVNLTKLQLAGNLLKKIDLSNNKKLKKLDLYQNQISEIDLSRSIELQTLFLSKNQLSQLDISHNRKITELSLNLNKLYEIDLSNFPSLKQYNLYENSLEKVVIWWNPELKKFQLQNQRSAACEITLLCKDQAQNCAGWAKKEIVQKYQDGIFSSILDKKLNKYKCKYIIRVEVKK